MLSLYGCTHTISRKGRNTLELGGMFTQIEGFDATASRHPRRKTYGVKVGHVRVGGGAPSVVQSMTNTDTTDIGTALKQTLELAEARPANRGAVVCRAAAR